MDAPMPRRRMHRITFLLAGIYNLVWGLWTGLDPQWLFREDRSAWRQISSHSRMNCFVTD